MKMNSRMIMRIAAVVILVVAFGLQWWGRQHRAGACHRGRVA